MTLVRPFPAKVVRQEWAEHVVSPLLESLSPEERARRLAANPHSYLHVTRSERDFGGHVTAAEIRTADAQALQRLIDAGAYEDSAPALFVYRLSGPTEHTGVVGEVDTAAFVSGQVRGHESVQADRVQALVDQFAVVPARSELVALLHSAGPEVAAIVEAICETPPLLRFRGHDGIEQTIWRVQGEESTATLSAELGRGAHYIADGHHRVAATVHEWELRGRPPSTGVLCVIYPLNGLDLMPFHRRVRGPMDQATLLASLGSEFTIKEVAHPTDSTGSFCLYLAGRWYDGSFTPPRPPGVAGLDAAILHDRVLAPLLDIHAAGDPRLEVASGRSPLADLAARCDEDGGALFVLRAPTIDELMTVADRGEAMAPKTTYFEPKPQAGIFLRFS